ncbi:MAG TPA: hypothetical protein VM681_08440 [Candidatus Thermoplasmatota archaeon]|nr:hypothetical protein [Candidatus Thermoplasmatota archaeon]
MNRLRPLCLALAVAIALAGCVGEPQDGSPGPYGDADRQDPRPGDGDEPGEQNDPNGDARVLPGDEEQSFRVEDGGARTFAIASGDRGRAVEVVVNLTAVSGTPYVTLRAADRVTEFVVFEDARTVEGSAQVRFDLELASGSEIFVAVGSEGGEVDVAFVVTERTDES